MISPDSPSTEPARLRTRLTRGVAWNSLGVVFNQGSTFVVNVLLARVLGLTVFGEYAMVQSTVQVAALLAQVATAYTATKYVAEFRSTDPLRAGRILALLGLVVGAMATVTAMILLLGSQWIAHSLLNQPALAPALAIASAAIFFSAINLFLMGALAGLESYRTLAFAGIASGLMYVAISLTAAKIAGLTGAVAGVALSGLLQAALLWHAVRIEARRQGIPLRIGGLRADTDILLRFAIPAALNGFIAVPAIWASNAFLARQENGYALLALFSAANNFRIIVLFLPNIVNNVSMSLLNNQKGLRDHRRYRRVFWTNLAATFCVVVCGSFTVALVGRWLLSWFGPGFSQGYNTLLVLMAVTILESASTALFQIVQSRERIWLSVGAVALPCYGTIAVVSWWLTPSYGALGLAFGHFAGWAVALIAIIAIVSRLGISLPNTTIAPVRA